MRRLLVALGTLSLALSFAVLAPPVSNAAPGTPMYGFRAFTGGTWAAAVADARSHGWKIASITSSSEQAAAVTALGSNVSAWIGATDARREGTWKWTTGGAAFFVDSSSGGSTVHGGYAHWGDNEPNDAGGEDCAIMYNTTYWNDMPCDNTGVAGYLYMH